MYADMAYKDLLTAAVESYPTAPDHEHVAAFLVALADLDAVRYSGTPAPASRVVAHEVAYDAALIKLSEHLGIDTDPERFKVPFEERERLHRAVAEALPSLHEIIFPGDPDESSSSVSKG